MLRNLQILVSTLVLAASAATLPGCGQPGPLYLPTEPAALRRASLPETLLPGATSKEDDAITTTPPRSPTRPSTSP